MAEDTLDKKLKTDVKKFEDGIKAAEIENKKLKNAMDVLREENKKLRKFQEENSKSSEAINYYKNIAEIKFRECSALAEQIICLRTDLDRLHSKYLKAQKELQGVTSPQSARKTNGQQDKLTPKKEKNYNSSLARGGSLGSNSSEAEVKIKKKVTIIAPMQKHENIWENSEDIKTPSPMVFGNMPLKEEQAKI